MMGRDDFALERLRLVRLTHARKQRAELRSRGFSMSSANQGK